jgi:hypothetical protein
MRRVVVPALLLAALLPLDAPAQVRPPENPLAAVPRAGTVSGVRVILTNRPSVLRGGLTNEKREPVEGTVVVFAEDAAHWREGSRLIRSARPDQNGEFSVKGLPPGEYLITALDYVQDGQWNDPEFLEGLRRRAERITLAEAESKRVDLTLKK